MSESSGASSGEDADLSGYFARLNENSLARRLAGPVVRKERLSSEEAVKSYAEHLAKAELLLDAEIEHVSRGGKLGNSALILMKLVLDGKVRLVELLKKSGSFGKHAYLFQENVSDNQYSKSRGNDEKED